MFHWKWFMSFLDIQQVKLWVYSYWEGESNNLKLGKKSLQSLTTCYLVWSGLWSSILCIIQSISIHVGNSVFSANIWSLFRQVWKETILVDSCRDWDPFRGCKFILTKHHNLHHCSLLHCFRLLWKKSDRISSRCGVCRTEVQSHLWICVSTRLGIRLLCPSSHGIQLEKLWKINDCYITSWNPLVDLVVLDPWITEVATHTWQDFWCTRKCSKSCSNEWSHVGTFSTRLWPSTREHGKSEICFHISRYETIFVLSASLIMIFHN